jgi:hypothetical protein
MSFVPWQSDANSHLYAGGGLQNAQTAYNASGQAVAGMGGGQTAQTAAGVYSNADPAATAPLTSWKAVQQMGDGGGGYQGFMSNLPAVFMSDARMKTDIRPVGLLDNGLPVYAFRFKSGGPTQIGLLAQEVAQVMPQAVEQGPRGILGVNYDMATQGHQMPAQSAMPHQQGMPPQMPQQPPMAPQQAPQGMPMGGAPNGMG